MGEGLGLSNAVVASIAVVLTLALSIAAYAYYNVSLQASQNVAREEAISMGRELSEKLTLLYWSYNGDAWISNDGKTDVKIVKIWVDGVEVWKSRGYAPLTVGAGQTVKIYLGSRGDMLAVETDSGNIIVLEGSG